ncbi:MAG: hypothetical protein M1151_05405 [Candidatus Thermoplasmatota archaeon]|jgi:hypothetical protein|nr:hypothetical protein [Candidatus Thermoplasmatota archaeon]
MTYERKRVLLTVKAYPERSKKYGACVCTAGITDSGEFIRLYPVPFESFRGGKKIPKYSWITVDCEKASEYLNRKESHRIRYETLKVENQVSTGSDNSWDARNRIVLPLLSESMEELETKSKTDNVSLGLIKPREITDLTIDARHDTDGDEKEILKEIQLTLEGEKRTDLEGAEYNFRYHFSCQDPDCKGHSIMCEDWEMIESWRSWKKKYPDRDILVQKFRQKYLGYMQDRNLHFFVGTHSRFSTWLIIGLYYPPNIT